MAPPNLLALVQSYSATVSSPFFVLLPILGVLLCCAATSRLAVGWWRLRHIAGPFWAKVTNLQRVHWVQTGRAHLIHQQVHADYGDVVRTGPNMVSISNPEDIPIVYPMRPGLPKGDFYATLRPYTRGSGAMIPIFNAQDEKMHKLIKNPIAPLFSLSSIVAFEPRINQVLDVLATQLDKRFVETGDIANLGNWIQYFSYDVMGTITFSKVYGFLEQGQDVNSMISTIYAYMRTAAPMTQIPWMDSILYKNRLVDSIRRTPGLSILTFVKNVIYNRRLQLQSHNDEKPKSAPPAPSSTGLNQLADKDFLTRYIEIQTQNPSIPPWAPIAWTASNVIAGSNTVGVVMTGAMYNIVAHRGTYHTLHTEIHSANLSRPHPTWTEIRDLPYLDACVHEAIRMYPPLALPFERVVPREGITVSGVYLPGGTIVGGSPHVVNRHRPTFGEDADFWVPERWLRGDAQYRKKLEQSILSFGAGRRTCMGKNIGIMETKKLVAFLMLNYSMDIESPETFEVVNNWFLVLTGFHARIKRLQI